MTSEMRPKVTDHDYRVNDWNVGDDGEAYCAVGPWRATEAEAERDVRLAAAITNPHSTFRIVSILEGGTNMRATGEKPESATTADGRSENQDRSQVKMKPNESSSTPREVGRSGGASGLEAGATCDSTEIEALRELASACRRWRHGEPHAVSLVFDRVNRLDVLTPLAPKAPATADDPLIGALSEEGRAEFERTGKVSSRGIVDPHPTSVAPPHVGVRLRLREVAKGKLDPDAEADQLHTEIGALVDWARADERNAANRLPSDAIARAEKAEAALEVAIALAEEGWGYAAPHFREKWKCEAKANELRAIAGVTPDQPLPTEWAEELLAKTRGEHGSGEVTAAPRPRGISPLPPSSDWTKAPEGGSNSSPLFLHIVDRVESILRGARLDTVAPTARLIVAQLAHVHGLEPRSEAAQLAPIPMVLHCPDCRVRHIDEGDFATRPHHTHSCQGCGLTWRPSVVHTVGVQFLPGFKNDRAAEYHAQGNPPKVVLDLVQDAYRRTAESEAARPVGPPLTAHGIEIERERCARHCDALAYMLEHGAGLGPSPGSRLRQAARNIRSGEESGLWDVEMGVEPDEPRTAASEAAQPSTALVDAARAIHAAFLRIDGTTRATSMNQLWVRLDWALRDLDAQPAPRTADAQPKIETAREMWLATPGGSFGRPQIPVEQYEELRALACRAFGLPFQTLQSVADDAQRRERDQHGYKGAADRQVHEEGRRVHAGDAAGERRGQSGTGDAAAGAGGEGSVPTGCRCEPGSRGFACECPDHPDLAPKASPKACVACAEERKIDMLLPEGHTCRTARSSGPTQAVDRWRSILGAGTEEDARRIQDEIRREAWNAAVDACAKLIDDLIEKDRPTLVHAFSPDRKMIAAMIRASTPFKSATAQERS